MIFRHVRNVPQVSEYPPKYDWRVTSTSECLWAICCLRPGINHLGTHAVLTSGVYPPPCLAHVGVIISSHDGLWQYILGGPRPSARKLSHLLRGPLEAVFWVPLCNKMLIRGFMNHESWPCIMSHDTWSWTMNIGNELWYMFMYHGSWLCIMNHESWSWSMIHVHESWTMTMYHESWYMIMNH